MRVKLKPPLHLSCGLLGAPHGDWFDKCIVGRSDVQLAEIIRRFIDAHPERWHEGLNGLSYFALTESCKGDK